MGRSLHLTVVAEGVENTEQLEFLQAYGCAEGQGYYFSRPVDPTACQALISVGALRGAAQRSSSPVRDLK
jgi:EAL domain-containing protein (putative c-di-GMP-specific phosphodiesterase class I)